MVSCHRNQGGFLYGWFSKFFQYTIDGIAFSLRPGQEHDLTADQTQTLQLHREGKFPDVSYLLSVGTYSFAVSESGLELVETREPPSGTRP